MLHPAESKMLNALSRRMSADELASQSGVPLSSILSFSQSLKEKGYAVVDFVEETKLELSQEARRFATEGLPEQKVLLAAQEGMPLASLSQEERTIGLAWASKNGWVKVESSSLKGSNALAGEYGLQGALLQILSGAMPDSQLVSILEKRRLVTQHISKTIYLEPTAVQPKLQAGEEEGVISALTRQMLLSKSFKGKLFRKYNVSAPVEVPSPAKRHMVRRLQARISRIFSDMGFEEMEGSEIQSSFWNFDALFQPQDHPARDLADTFYLEGDSPLPDDSSLVEKVKKIHQVSWGGEWTEKNASRPVLRTHTTAVSARYLNEQCKGSESKKYFSIGKVYRNEATDYKHLAEFYQVEGIVVWDGATFRDLLGCLKEFYRRLGFEKIRFQPSYFPYTEPSLEISVYFEKKGQCWRGRDIPSRSLNPALRPLPCACLGPLARAPAHAPQ
ncbi:MAG: phenylalanine--tRNA ligase subunit alpha [Candidatus Micrarchaeota archaeon]|nr:phenylalanine--tRNA ligase subunit alpha [Candidatus Micrarchaeota archaeon]